MESAFSLWIPLYLPLLFFIGIWWRLNQIERKVDDCCKEFEELKKYIKVDFLPWLKDDFVAWAQAAHRALCNLEKDRVHPGDWTQVDAICKNLGGTDPRDPPGDPPPFM